MENNRFKPVATIYPLHKYDLKEQGAEKRFSSHEQICDKYPQCLLSQKQFADVRNLNKKNQIVKRISPFLIVACCLPVLFTYLVIISIYSTWLLFLLFIFIQVNILCIDFLIWNYHEEQKIWRIWLIEMSVIFIASYFII